MNHAQLTINSKVVANGPSAADQYRLAPQAP